MPLIVSPHVTWRAPRQLGRALRQSDGLSHAPLVVALRDDRDDECEGVDASVAWPFRPAKSSAPSIHLPARQPRAESERR